MQQLTFFMLLIASLGVGIAQRWTRENINFPDIFEGPYNDAVLVHDTMYVSGLHAENPGNMTFAAETREVLDSLRRYVQAGRMTMQHVAKTTVYLTDWKNYDEMNKIYREYFPEKFPARSALQVVKLHQNAHVQIEAVAVRSDL